jgi:dipeptidyl aminopeptidase/acylaminoacyl peptidase
LYEQPGKRVIYGGKWVTPTIAPYGSWKSPITSDLIVAGTIGLSDVVVSGDNIYWIESRPAERGRRSIQRRSADGEIRELTPSEFNVRTRLHEYGGAAYEVDNDTIYFQNFADQLMYRHDAGSAPRPITTSGIFYADFRIDKHRNRLVSIQEDHGISDIEAVNTLVSLNPSGPNADGGVTMVSGADFLSNPRLSPDGQRMAWLEWSHPNMPWDAAELWVGDVDVEGAIHNGRKIAGGNGSSVFQPEWTPAGDLIFVDDRSGWWNFYRYRNGEIEHLLDMEAEFGSPLWVVGMTTYVVVSGDRIICTYSQNGFSHLGDLNLATGKFSQIPTPFTEVDSIATNGTIVAFVAGSPNAPNGLYQHDLRTGETTLIRSASTVTIDPEYLSDPELVTFPTSDDQIAHGFLYLPKNKDFAAPDDELPPLIVTSHGGPTSAATTSLRLPFQFWTSRGFALLDVDYRGSTGYGRPYRDALRGTWGIYDVDDCVYGAKYLVEQGVVDGERLAVRGGSASGYLTLAALTFRDTFDAGCALYGISDLEVMALETHKFESRYLDGLVAPYPEGIDIYKERSPLYHIDQLNTPLILFHGLEDKVVPPNQSEMIYDALKEKGVPVALVLYEGEQHGFRQAANIKRTLDGELYFYSRIFGFEPADPIEPIPIANLD